MKCIVACYGCQDDKGSTPKKSVSYCLECAEDQQDRHRRMGHRTELTVIRDDNPAKAFRMIEMASGLPFLR